MPPPKHPSLTFTRPFSTSPRPCARLMRRPHRPYEFTQLIALSDGSTSLHRTTSPLPIYRSVRDTRNTPLWNPSDARLANQEEDEAGRLSAFRKRFGRGWDTQAAPADETLATPDESAQADQIEGAKVKGKSAASVEPGEATVSAGEDEGDNLMDLISSFGDVHIAPKAGVTTAREVKTAAKGKKK